jgi:hypothetical protein
MGWATLWAIFSQTHLVTLFVIRVLAIFNLPNKSIEIGVV